MRNYNNHLRDILIKLNNRFENTPIYFLSNKQEGILEKQTYTRFESENLKVLKNAFLESKNRETRETEKTLRPITTITDCIYGSIGSSSSQILIPVKSTTRTRLINILKTQFKQTVNIHDGEDGWVIVLIASNNLHNQDTSNFIVFDVLKTIYETTGLLIAVSNALAHRIYGHGKTYSDIDDLNAYHVATLKTIIETNRICVDEKNHSVKRALYKMDLKRDHDFLRSTIVIPKFDNRVTRRYNNLPPEKYKIINDWIFAIGKGYADIGGSVTNKYFYQGASGEKMIVAIKKAAKHNQIPVLTGRIRAAIECEYKQLDDILYHDPDSGLFSFRKDFQLKNKTKTKQTKRTKRTKRTKQTKRTKRNKNNKKTKRKNRK